MSTLGPVSIIYNSTLTRAVFSCPYDMGQSSAYRRIVASFGGYSWKERLSGSAPSGTFEQSNLSTAPEESYPWSIKVQYCDISDDPDVETSWRDSTLSLSGTSYSGSVTTDGFRVFIGNGSSMLEYTAYICNGVGWNQMTPKIGNGTSYD